MKKFCATVLLSICCASMTGCAANTRDDDLYQSLGGIQGIEQIVNVFIRQVAKDEAIFPYFAKSSVGHFRHGFTQHLCAVSGGPCTYTGDNMVDIHTGMNINEADFNRVVEILVFALEQNNVDYPSQNRLLRSLAPMRGDVIKR